MYKLRVLTYTTVKLVRDDFIRPFDCDEPPSGFPANSMLFFRCSSVNLIFPSKRPAGMCMLSASSEKSKSHLALHAVRGDQSVKFFLLRPRELSRKEIVISNNKKYLTFPKIDVQNRLKGSFRCRARLARFQRKHAR